MLGRWIAVLALASCVSSSSVRCPDGSLCPDGSACASVDDVTLCVAPDDVAVCVGAEEFAECGETKRCYQGVCLPTSCGNSRVEPGEACDDGNTIAGDGCSGDCRSNETCGNGVIDLIRGETCDDGEQRTTSHDGCAADCTTETPQWVQFPMPRFIDTFPAWTYDAARDRVVLFGTAFGASRTLEWDGRRWFVATPAISPPPRTRHALAYDAARKRVVLFGGVGFSDTWEYDGANWTLVQAPMSPAARCDHTLVYDAKLERVVLFGGRPSPAVNAEFGDTWAWNGVAWTQIATTGPTKRFDHAAAYDPKRGVVVLFGGGENGASNADTWELDGSTWTQRTPAMSPGPRHSHAMTFDPKSGMIVLNGGAEGFSPAVVRFDTWTWDGTQWTQLAIPDIPGSGQNVMLTTFGRTGNVVAFPSQLDTFRLAPAGWQRIETSVSSISNRSDAASAVDVRGGRVVIHSGISGAFIPATTLVFNGTWQSVSAGTPGARTGAAMAFDEQRREFVLFGGVDNNGNIKNDTWVFDGTAWTQRTPAMSPPARLEHAMVYDVARGRVVIFGGRDESVTPALRGDMWQWDGTTWSPVTTTLPPARTAPAATYDPIANVVVLFGGTTSTTSVQGMQLQDTWTWDGTAWTQRASTGPSGRFSSAMAWDAARKRAVLFGGASPVQLNDQWEWNGSSWTQLTVTTPQAPRSGHMLVSSIDGAGVLVFGGLGGNPFMGDLARLVWDGPALDETCVPADLDGDGLAGCADPDCAWACGTCGNTTCEPHESCVTCASDCGACATTCGDFTCTETAATCPGDC